MRVAISQYQCGRPKNAKTKIAITITQSKNAVPQRGWIRLWRCTVSGVELLARLVGVDRLVLGSVVLEHAPQVREQRDQEEVEDEDRRRGSRPRRSRTSRGVDPDPVGEQRRADLEEQKREADRDREREDQLAAGDLGLDLLAFLVLSSCAA